MRDEGSVFFDRKEIPAYGEETLVPALGAIFEEEAGLMNVRGYAMVTYSCDGCSIRASFSGHRM